MQHNSIKALAARVLEQDRHREVERKTLLKLVPKTTIRLELSGTKHPSAEWAVEDWNAYFYERAGILEYDSHLPRPEAERRAYGMTLVKWMDVHRPSADKLDLCAHCQSDRTSAVIIPCLSGSGGHYGVHDKCLPEALEVMRQQGIAALSLCGLSPGLAEKRGT